MESIEDIDGTRAGAARRARNRELLVGLVCAALFVFYGFLASQIKTFGLGAQGIGATFFPNVLSVGGALLSLVYCVAVFVWPSRTDELQEEDAVPASVVRPLSIVAAPILWALVLPIAGFIASTWALVTALILLFDGMQTRSWLIAPAILTVGLWIIFNVVLDVQLPSLALP